MTIKINRVEEQVVYVDLEGEHSNVEMNDVLRAEIKSELGLPARAVIEMEHMKTNQIRVYIKKSVKTRATAVPESDLNHLYQEIQTLRLENERLKKELLQIKPPVPRSHEDCLNSRIIDATVYPIYSKESVQLWDLITDQKKACVLDFWSTTCPNCPQAVDVLQQHAKLHDCDDVLLLIINTDNQEKAKPIIQHKNWIFGQHLYMPLAEKEKMKAFLGMKTLPHHVMIGNNGVIVGNGANFKWPELMNLVPKMETVTIEPQNETEPSMFSLDEDF